MSLCADGGHSISGEFWERTKLEGKIMKPTFKCRPRNDKRNFIFKACLEYSRPP